MSDDELSKILDESRDWNINHGITGMLIYVEGKFAGTTQRSVTSATAGRFMQILEGSKEEVQYIFDKIRIDSRHYDVTPLEQAPSAMRYFEDWYMGFESISINESTNGLGYFNPAHLFYEDHDIPAKHPLAYLRSFYQRGKSQAHML